MNIDGHQLELKNLDKIYFPKDNITKGEVVDYYLRMSRYILPHLYNRPFSMIYFPEGKVENSFFQKQRPANFPDFVESVKVQTSKEIDYVMVNNLPTLLYLAGKSIMEMHTWFSRVPNLTQPDLAVIDLDPSGQSGISEAVTVAQAFHELLQEFNIYSVPKTSGSRGIHIFIPLKTGHTFESVQEFLKPLCAIVTSLLPDIATTERTIAKRGNRIYLDAVQCGYGKTLAMPYSLRVKAGAPVSTPLEWSEVNQNLKPAQFNIRTIEARVKDKGDLMGSLYAHAQNLPKLKH